MARPRSDIKPSAIIAGATRVIASQGLSASTAAIAKESGVSNGSLFTYFETKADLLNKLYVELKTEMAEATLEGLTDDRDLREQALRVWSQWLNWATSYPEKRRTLALLNVSDDITAESQQTASRAMTEVRKLLNRVSENGPMRDTPLEFRLSLMNGVAEATIQFMIHDPADADTHCTAGFEAFWRMTV
ncbi:TetR/AcrR family transcriptional regulator [Saccharibacillus sp. CPCC 101409]|uniref:TetR/AcrR family transcriptional regulator n=1 Tax=Saccharibacillus sp. CPCC 101409 TaxID=3058041 RepID=UPI002671A1EC|nr:TetR/AcrR family transcriptional regulator [Saccharibacillus sp. CPCC 101409]MDO3411548.1 TetR/AcrR family transcriptional regulator [Saccharibacillus sp. CPCC 101409]